MQDIIVIGSGPAGISAAVYAARAGLKAMVISENLGALTKAEKIENYYGFAFPVPGKTLVDDGIEQARNLGVEIVSAQVVSIDYGTGFVVKTKDESFNAPSVVLATGSNRTTPKIKGFADYEGKGISYCAVCDAFFYRGKSVAVLGGGEYALHEATELLPIAKSVTLLTNGVEPVEGFPDEITILQQPIDGLEGDEVLERVRFKDGSTLEIAGIFIALGVAGSSDLARKLGAQTDGQRIVVDENMASNVPGLFAAGDCTGGMMQIVKAAYEGAKAGTEAVKFVRKLKASE
jgi:thioredoxin reductase (NADPH)